MSSSGPLLPTTAQEDPGETNTDCHSVPINTCQDNPASPLNSTSLTSSPSKTLCSQNKDEEKTKTPATSPIILYGVSEGKNQELETEGEDLGSENVPQQPLLHGERTSPIHQLPGERERSSQCRDYSSAYSEMFQDEGGGDGLAYVESDDDGAAVALRAVRWAESLQNLLSDALGADIFRKFMMAEVGSTHELDFWFACKGLAHQYKASVTTANDLVKILWRSFIRKGKNAVRVCDATYAAIEQRIEEKRYNAHIFDQAHEEVERQMSETLYRAFLKSDHYLSFLSLGRREAGLQSPHSPSPPSTQPPEGCYPPQFVFCNTTYLPTLHEDSEFEIREKPHPASGGPRLTSSNLLASASYRANLERIKPEAIAGYYLKGSSSYNPSPYHAMYVSGHTVSLQDSELQSLSSGAHTDDTKSFTDSSVEAGSLSSSQPMTRKHFKRQNQRIRESALQNKESPLMTSLSGVHVIPRTMLNNQSSYPRADTNPTEFVRVLCEKLERSQQNQESRERLMQSMCKITHSEYAPEEARREHAVNALPPNVLLNKLNEKVQLDDQNPSQSILDEHVARVWDSPICSPSSPKLTYEGSPPRGTKATSTRQLPHLSYPQPVSASGVTAHMSKVSLKPGRYHSTYVPAPPSALYPNVSQSAVGTRGRHPTAQSVGTYVGLIPHGHHQPKTSGHHGRRRERGPDVYSTFSSDSGNVADYHESSESVPPAHLPKSRSMPEYIENHTAGATSDGASSGGRRHPNSSGTRRFSRRPPADFTDSGVSVVSDSGRSGAPSTSSDRVESWLFQSRPFTSGGNSSYSTCPGADRESSKELQKTRGSRSTYTVAGSMSPGMQGRGGGSSGRKSQCSSSTSGNTCIANPRAEVLPSGNQVSSRPFELPRDSPLGQAQSHSVTERRKNKGGSSSSKSTGQSSSVGDGSGSNGSTLKKTQKSSKSSETPALQSSVSQSSNLVPVSAVADVTTIVYSFQDDHVPFIIKVPSRPVTLKKFKQHLHKKGAYRYFFKKFREDMGMVYEEIMDDAEILPLFEGKVFVQIHKDDKE